MNDNIPPGYSSYQEPITNRHIGTYGCYPYPIYPGKPATGVKTVTAEDRRKNQEYAYDNGLLEDYEV